MQARYRYLVTATFVASLLRATNVAAQAPPTGSAAAIQPAKPPVLPEVLRLHREGTTAFNAGDYEAAYEAFSAAWKLQKLPKIAGDLGAAELKLHRYRDAAEHLASCLREQKDIGAEERTEVQADLELAKKQVATVRIDATQSGAEISVDGTPVGTSPIDRDLYLDPGKRRLDGRVGEQRVTMVLDLQKGSRQSVTLEFQPPASPKAPVPVVLPPQVPLGKQAAPSRGPWSGGWIIGGGVAIAGLGVALGTGVAALVKADEQGRCLRESCLLALEPERHTLAQVSLGAGIAGGTAALFTAGYLLLERRTKTDKPPAVRISPTGTGLAISGTW